MTNSTQNATQALSESANRIEEWLTVPHSSWKMLSAVEKLRRRCAFDGFDGSEAEKAYKSSSPHWWYASTCEIRRPSGPKRTNVRSRTASGSDTFTSWSTSCCGATLPLLRSEYANTPQEDPKTSRYGRNLKTNRKRPIQLRWKSELDGSRRRRTSSPRRPESSPRCRPRIRLRDHLIGGMRHIPSS
jgi:hypothetical protein